MSNSTENCGSGSQPEAGKPGAAQPVVTKFTKRPEDERTGGITKLKGTTTFTSLGAVSINVKVEGGSTTDTSAFEAAGTQGDSVSNGAGRQTATLNATTERVTASGLATASATKNYTVQVSYTLTTYTTVNGHRVGHDTIERLNGTINKADISFANPMNDAIVTLT